jgi:hypothetical protein
MLVGDWHEFGKAILHSMKDSFINKEANVNSREIIVQLAHKATQNQEKKDKSFV